MLSKNDRYIVALSGGADSVYLLRTMILQGYTNLVAVHINHNIRKESIKDEQFCIKLCNELNIKIHIKSIDVPTLAYKKNLEEVAREKRYEILEDIRIKENAKYILVAHHQDDLIETMFLNILRGSGIRGIAGLQYQNGYIIRPLLDISKIEILNTCKKNKWKYITDQSNFDIKYSRNFLRHKIIPLFKNISNYNPTNISNLSKRIQEVNECIDNIISTSIKKIAYKENMYILDKFLTLDFFLQKEIIFFWYKEIYGDRLNFYEPHINQIIDILKKEKSNVQKEFGNKAWIKVNKHNNIRYICIKLK